MYCNDHMYLNEKVEFKVINNWGKFNYLLIGMVSCSQLCGGNQSTKSQQHIFKKWTSSHLSWVGLEHRQKCSVFWALNHSVSKATNNNWLYNDWFTCFSQIQYTSNISHLFNCNYFTQLTIQKLIFFLVFLQFVCNIWINNGANTPRL